MVLVFGVLILTAEPREAPATEEEWFLAEPGPPKRKRPQPDDVVFVAK